MTSNNQSRDLESQIIKAAQKVFVCKGYEATRMADIAQEVGISRTALHYYYRTKDMLFEAMLGEVLDALLPNIELILNKEGTIVEKIPYFVHAYTMVLMNNNFLPLFIVNELNRAPNHFFYALTKDVNRLEPALKLRQTIEREIEVGLLRPMPLIDVVSAFTSNLVFPILMKKTFTDLFLEGKEEKFREYYLQHKNNVTQIMIHLLTPQ